MDKVGRWCNRKLRTNLAVNCCNCCCDWALKGNRIKRINIYSIISKHQQNVNTAANTAILKTKQRAKASAQPVHSRWAPDGQHMICHMSYHICHMSYDIRMIAPTMSATTRVFPGLQADATSLCLSTSGQAPATRRSSSVPDGEVETPDHLIKQ